MIADRIHLGDTIGIISPSYLATRESYLPIFSGMRSLGFQIKEGKTFTKTLMVMLRLNRNGLMIFMK